MVHTETSIVIHRPLPVVWDFLANVDNAARWQTGVTDVSATDGANLGSEVSVTSHNFGRSFTTTVKITETDGKSRVKAEGISGPIRISSKYTLERIDSKKTRLILVTEGKASAFFKMAQPALQYMAEIKQESDLKLLKAVMEAEVPETTA